ncbi:hypothetical protein HZS_7564 [Henneguya salminicola]|nr:hypothetical protein HZS_7564 [Henneguya salminicola]
MELLSQISHSEINEAIAYIQIFLSYLGQTGLIRFDPSLWNISEFERAEMVNRTNIVIERYNRRLNENFSNAHTNLYAFIEVNIQEFEYYQERCTEIRQNTQNE